MLLCHSNHSAFNSHNFPRTYTTTYPYVAEPPQPNALTRKAQGFGNYLVSSGCTYGLDTVSFHSICVEVSFATVSAQSFARSPAGLLATHLAIVYSVYSAYLPGLPLRVPRRLRKVRDSNPPDVSFPCGYFAFRHSRFCPCRIAVVFIWPPLSQPSMLRLLRHNCIVSTVLVESSAVVFFVFTSPFSFPSLIIRCILCSG